MTYSKYASSKITKHVLGTVFKNWTDFKSLIDAGTIQWHFLETISKYELFGVQGPIIYSAAIMKDGGADNLDFENNYKNVPTTTFLQWVESKLYGKKSNGSFIPLAVLDDGKLPVVASVPGSPIGATPIKFVSDGILNNNVKRGDSQKQEHLGATLH